MFVQDEHSDDRQIFAADGSSTHGISVPGREAFAAIGGGELLVEDRCPRWRVRADRGERRGPIDCG